MLIALKSSTENFLEEPLSSTLSTVSFPISPLFRNQTINAASALSLRLLTSHRHQGGRMAWEVYRNHRGCDMDGDVNEELILTVEYSRAALSAIILEAECNMALTARTFHDVELGQDALAGAESLAKVVSGLRKFTTLPLQYGEGTEPDSSCISGLILLGESSQVPLLQEALKAVLGFTFDASDDKLDGQNRTDLGAPRVEVFSGVDPVFVAARGAARDCWFRLKAIKEQAGPCKFQSEERSRCAEFWADSEVEDQDVV